MRKQVNYTVFQDATGLTLISEDPRPINLDTRCSSGDFSIFIRGFFRTINKLNEKESSRDI